MPKSLTNAGKHWSVSDVKMLEDDIKMCMSTSEIAKQLGRSEEAIVAKAHHEHMSVKGLGFSSQGSHGMHGHSSKKW